MKKLALALALSLLTLTSTSAFATTGELDCKFSTLKLNNNVYSSIEDIEIKNLKTDGSSKPIYTIGSLGENWIISAVKSGVNDLIISAIKVTSHTLKDRVVSFYYKQSPIIISVKTDGSISTSANSRSTFPGYSYDLYCTVN